MRLGDWELFWVQHRDRPLLVDAVNNEKCRNIWESAVKFFGLEVDEPEGYAPIREMNEKARKLRNRSKRK